MRTVKSISELQRLAVNSGAVVRLDGRAINAAGTKAMAVAPRPVEPPPPEKTAPAPAQEFPDHRPELYALMAEQARDQARLTETLMASLALQRPERPRTSWRFDVSYDPTGQRVLSVVAHPVEG